MAPVTESKSKRLLRYLVERAGALRERWWFRRCVAPLLASRFGQRVAVALLRSVGTDLRPAAARVAHNFYQSVGRQAPFLAVLRNSYKSREKGNRLEVLVLVLIEAQQFSEAWNLLSSDRRGLEHLKPNFLHAWVRLAFELARYEEVVAAVEACARTCPDHARSHYDFLKGAFAASMCLKHDLALQFFGRQFRFLDDNDVVVGPDVLERIKEQIIDRVFAVISHKLIIGIFRNPEQKIGVFFLNSTEALGHAILDPYHFLALNKLRFDEMIFVGPDPLSYRPASRACLAIVEQYGSYLTTDDQMLLNLSWMSLGTFAVGPIELVVENYWSLLREVVHRTRASNHEFEHNRWHMSLPRSFEHIGAEFCARHGINPDAPIVVLHVRERGYHGLLKQSYRDAEIADYEPATKFLIDQGYQVIRVGDMRMRKSRVVREGYFELPFMIGYVHQLDSFFISHCSFMIGSQSGPCAYARAFGRPVLSANAVYHYTLLPSPRELACFKHYLMREATGGMLRLGEEEILRLRLFHLDNSNQFERASVELQNASAAEILAATEQMVAWCRDPDQPETPAQSAFRDVVSRAASDLQKAEGLQPSVGDFIGFSLPGYRLAAIPGDIVVKAAERIRAE